VDLRAWRNANALSSEGSDLGLEGSSPSARTTHHPLPCGRSSVGKSSSFRNCRSGVQVPSSTPTTYGRSSTGRASVSKTECWGFESPRPCHRPSTKKADTNVQETRGSVRTQIWQLKVRVLPKVHTDRRVGSTLSNYTAKQQKHHFGVVQLVERKTLNLDVGGSNPPPGAGISECGCLNVTLATRMPSIPP